MKNIISGIIWLIVALSFFAEGLNLEIGPLSAPGPGFFPMALGAALFFLSLSQMIIALRAKEEPSRKEPFLAQLRISPPILASLLALIFYMIFLNVLGYILTTFLFIFFLITFISKKPLRFSIFIAILTSTLSYTIFRIALAIPLPKGFIHIG